VAWHAVWRWAQRPESQAVPMQLECPSLVAAATTATADGAATTATADADADAGAPCRCALTHRGASEAHEERRRRGAVPLA
jgi:hypothetical protein